MGRQRPHRTLNHITPARLVAAARLVRAGKNFDLGLALGADGIQIGIAGRKKTPCTQCR